jgi:hypothetical protein
MWYCIGYEVIEYHPVFLSMKDKWETRMSTITAPVDAGVVIDGLEAYQSRPMQLARWLLESRNTLRRKYRALKVESKRLKVRVNDVLKSRDMWKRRANLADQQVLAVKAEVERLSKELERLTNAAAPKKTMKSQAVR